MKLIVISSSGKAEDEAKQVTEMFQQGLDTFHLRKTRFSTRQLGDYIRQIPVAFHNRIIIHNHHNLALKFNLRGIHLGRYHRKKKIRTWIKLRVLHMKKPDLVVSTSYRNLQSVYDGEGNYTYVFLSPIFDSLSGKYQSGFTEHSLKAATTKSKFRIIARGGITIDIIPKIKELGFAGVAFYSALWNKKEPVAEFIRVLDEMKRLGIDRG